MSEKLHRASAWDLISRARPLIGPYMEALRNHTIPDIACLAELREILTGYISELERCEALAEKFGNFSFANCSGQDVSDSEMIEEVSKKTDVFQILYIAAMKKLLSIDTDGVPADTAEWMVRTHYLAPVENSLYGSGKLYGITSKGYDCLTRKKIRSRLCKENPTNTIPRALRIAPDEWNLFTLFQAAVIKGYYEQAGVKDYMIIPARDHKNVLLGCAISPDPDIQYVFAWIDAPEVLPDWKSCVQETVSAQGVSRITAVCRSEEERSALREAIRVPANAEKIRLSCLEVFE